MSRPMGTEITKLQMTAVQNICSKVLAYRDETGNAIVEIGKGDKKVAFSISPLGAPVDVMLVTANEKEETNQNSEPTNEKRGPGRPRKERIQQVLQKRRPGRPRKEDSTGAQAKNIQKKRRPGRPLGSKNKNRELVPA